MADVGVIDTGVLIGFTIRNDQHHETTRDYILDEGLDSIYIPPKAYDEFTYTEEKVRRLLHDEIRDHRIEVISEVGSETLEESGIRFIRDGLLERETTGRAFPFLYRYYTNIHEDRVPIGKDVIIRELSDMETEVMVDRSEEYGGWQSHVRIWAKGCDSYPSLEEKLLLSSQPDLEILIQAHHIAGEQNSKDAEFATANPNDFCRQRDGEKTSRKEDIVINTNLVDVIDLSNPVERHYA